MTLPARYVTKDANGRPSWRLRLVPLDATGKPVGGGRVALYDETTAGATYADLRFRFLTSGLPLERVKSVRLEVRPLHTTYFRGVPLQPK